jgi:hypothetical protein
MLEVAKSRDLAKNNGIEVRGSLVFQEDVGWIDRHKSYTYGYAIMCEVNTLMGYCPTCGCFETDYCTKNKVFNE